jgi:hypothetical protein
MRRIVSLFLILAGIALPLLSSAPVRAGTLPNISGTWYMGGDHSKRCRITQSGDSITVENERGQTATGRFVDSSHITTSWPMSLHTSMGPRTQVDGHISPDLDTILWNNSTFWTRGGSTTGNDPDICGAWYMSADPSKRCDIRQHGNSLTLTNESGQTATGSFVNPRKISARWGFREIDGHLSHDLWRIEWSNGTYWTRGTN